MSNPVTTEAESRPPAEMAPGPKASRHWKIIPLAIVVVVLLAGAAGGAYAYQLHHSGTKHTPPATLRTAATPDSYALPGALDGLPQSSDEDITSLSSAASQELMAALGDLKGKPIVGAYAATPPDAAVLIGLPATPNDPGTEISHVFSAVRSMHILTIPDPVETPAGVAGAEMRCSDGSLIGGVQVQVGACVEADSGGSVLLLRLTKSGADTGELLRSVLPAFTALTSGNTSGER
jgi:hypothetical protein